MDILEQIIAHKQLELPAIRKAVDNALSNYSTELLFAPKSSLRKALIESNTGIIAEFKRRSPSKGWIKEDGRADIIPLSYQHNGASALSILTDELYFAGQDDFILEAKQSGVTLPILYKNFVIDEAQLYAAALCGASAVLLIAACLTKDQCKSLLVKAHELGLEVLLEMHSETELEYTELKPDLYGINNRNLGTFITDVENSFHLVELLPKDSVKVSESGISNPETVKALRAAGFRGFLMGEHFMKSTDPGITLKHFIEKL